MEHWYSGVRHAWIRCRVELNHKVAVLPDLHDIATLRIVSVGHGAIPLAGSFVEDVHVESVQMHRVPSHHVRVSSLSVSVLPLILE